MSTPPPLPSCPRVPYVRAAPSCMWCICLSLSISSDFPSASGMPVTAPAAEGGDRCARRCGVALVSMLLATTCLAVLQATSDPSPPAHGVPTSGVEGEDAGSDVFAHPSPSRRLQAPSPNQPKMGLTLELTNCNVSASTTSGLTAAAGESLSDTNSDNPGASQQHVAGRIFFRDTLAVVMMSPARYHLAPLLKRHYGQFFTYMYFCGPKNDSRMWESHGIDIRGYDIVFGNEQYRAVASIIRQFEALRSTNGPSSSSPPSPRRHVLPRGTTFVPDLLARRWATNDFATAVDARHWGGANRSQTAALCRQDATAAAVARGEPPVWSANETITAWLPTGYFYIADDVIMNLWNLVARQLNRSRVWSTPMGIANVQSYKPVHAVPGMSVNARNRGPWVYWPKNRLKLLKVLKEGGEDMAAQLLRSARQEHGLTYRWSKWRGDMTDEVLRGAVFYTIVDTYYVPAPLAMPYAELCDLMAKHWVFGECAIATMLRCVDSTYEQINVQFYWSTVSAADCHRYKWIPGVDGFHRCRHDHPFVEALYYPPMRDRMLQNATLLQYMKTFTDWAPQPPPKDNPSSKH